MKKIKIFINAILLICTVLTIFGLSFYIAFQVFNAFVYKTSESFGIEVFLIFRPDLFENLLTTFPKLNLIVKTIYVLAFVDCVKGFIKKGTGIFQESIYIIGIPIILPTMIAKIVMLLR